MYNVVLLYITTAFLFLVAVFALVCFICFAAVDVCNCVISALVSHCDVICVSAGWQTQRERWKDSELK